MDVTMGDGNVAPAGWSAVTQAMGVFQATTVHHEDGLAVQRALDLVVMGRVSIAQQYHDFDRVEQRMTAVRAEVREQYRHELDEANEHARNCYLEAMKNQRYAEAYADATVMVGTKAVEELQAKDYSNYELQQECWAYRSLAQQWENNTEVVYGEAAAKIAVNMHCLASTEQQMQSFKSELEGARRFRGVRPGVSCYLSLIHI